METVGERVGVFVAEGVDDEERVDDAERDGVSAFVEESDIVGDGDGVPTGTPLNTE